MSPPSYAPPSYAPPSYAPPSYEESVGSPRPSISGNNESDSKQQNGDSHPIGASGHLSAIEKHFPLESLLYDHVYPALWPSLSVGNMSNTLILVPQNVAALHPATTLTEGFPGEEIIGIPQNRRPLMIRLTSKEYHLEILRRPELMHQVILHLCQFLNSRGCLKIVIHSNQIWTQATGPRKVSAAEKEDANARVLARIETACLRTETDMGLYETRSGKCLILDIDVYGTF